MTADKMQRLQTWRERIVTVLRRPATWITLTVAVAALDYFATPYVHLGVLYLLPIGVAAWFGALRWALAISFVLPALRLSYYVLNVWEPPRRFSDVFMNSVIRAGVLMLAALLIERVRRSRELQREVATLHGLLPICMYCKRIQDADNRWLPIEQYVAARSEAAFTHRVCPVCETTHGAVFLGGRV